MGMWDREKVVLSLVGSALRSVLGALGWLFDGRIRRRLVLGTLATGGVTAYIVGVWGIPRLLKDLLTLVFGVPAPGQPLAFGTWVAPRNGVWPDVMALSRVSMGVAGLLVLLLIARATAASDEAVRRRELKRVGRPAAMVAATWTALPFMLHLSDQLAGAMAPTPELLLTELGATAAGGVILGLLTWVQPLVVAVGVLSTVLLRAIILVGFVFWPVAWPLRALDHDFAQVLGRSVTAVFTVAVTAKLLQAVFGFLLMYTVGAIESWWLRPIVFIAGVILVFVAMPIVLLRYADRVMMLPGALALSERQVGQAIEKSADRVGQVHTHVESGRERVNEWRSTDPQMEVGDFTDDDGRWWNDSIGGDRWWNGWIQRELIPRHSSVEWRKQQDMTMDGSPGPESEGPDDDVSESRDGNTDRYRSWWDRP